MPHKKIWVFENIKIGDKFSYGEHYIDPLYFGYGYYLETDHWKITREQALERANWECQRCGHQYKLHVHHKTYENLGNEQPEDLVVLCKSCHEEEHFF